MSINLSILLAFGIFYSANLSAQTITLAYDAFGNRTSKTVIGTYPKPIVSGDSVVCQGDSAHLSASGGSTYYWSNGRTGSNTSVPGDSSRTYALTAISSAGCSTTIYRRVSVLPVPVTGAISGNSVVYAGGVDTFNVPAHASSIYSWNVTGNNSLLGNINSSQARVRWGATSGPDTIRLTEYSNGGQCKGQTVYKVVNIQTSASVPVSKGATANVIVYPNPATEGAWVKIQLVKPGDAVITIANETGQLLGRKSVSGKAAYEVPLEKSLFPVPGIYLIHVSYGANTSNHKLQIIR